MASFQDKNDTAQEWQYWIDESSSYHEHDYRLIVEDEHSHLRIKQHPQGYCFCGCREFKGPGYLCFNCGHHKNDHYPIMCQVEK